MFALTGYQHVLLYSSHKYYKNTKVWNKLPTSPPTFIQKLLWVVLHCFCCFLKVQWKHDVGFGSKKYIIMTKLWSTTSMKNKAFLSTKCLHVCNWSCSYCQTTFYSTTDEMLTVTFCKQKECAKAIVWNSVTKSRWGSRRMWAGQQSKNFNLFAVYEFAKFLYVSHLIVYRPERKWVGDNLQQRSWLWSKSK